MATEIRFAFALNGGVSLAIWIGGVVDEVLRFVDAGKRAANGGDTTPNPYVDLCRELDVIPKVDVLAGSSAGGLNAAFLATAVVHGCTDVDPPVTVRLTATSLGGRVTTISDGHGEIYAVDHRAEFVFTTRDFDFASEDRAVERLARACRSTASFPGAFEPSTVPVDLYAPRHVMGLFQNVEETSADVIDGAVLVNLPAQSAIEAIIHQPSRERIERVLALVVPDPGDLRAQDDDKPLTLNEVISKSVVGIPRTQSLTDFVRELNEHNLEVRSRRAARDAMLVQFADRAPDVAWRELAGVAAALFPAYRAMRAASSIDRIRLGLPLRLPRATAALDLTSLSADMIDIDTLPWVPQEPELGDSTWCWGSAPARRLVAVLITWINTVAAVAPPEIDVQLYAMKEGVSRVRAEADRISPVQGLFEDRLVEEMLRDPTSLAAAFERASHRWPSDDPAASITALNQHLVTLTDCMAEFVALARSTIEAAPVQGSDAHPLHALRGLLHLYDGAAASPGGPTRLLLCIEIIEATFAGLEPRPDQEIRLVQFTSKGAVTIDELGRSAPVDKLAGVELAHFGAFLKRSWRANDWMWGRLDAAERLVMLLDSMLGHRLTNEGTLADRTRAIQAEVLREELPTIVAEIEADAKLGARVSAEGKAFCAAVRTMVTTPEGPIDLSGLDERQLQELFALQLVGSENLQKEVGSNLATMTSIAALATTAGVLRAQGPRLLRGPISILGASTAVAWRISRRRRGRRLRILEGALVVIIGLLGLVGTVLDAFTSVDLGPFRYVGWSFLVLAPVLAVFAAPWLLVGVGRRLMGRQKPKH